MGCCFSNENSVDETQPLLTSNQKTYQSARPSRPAANAEKIGRLALRHVGVAELDQRFEDVAETFNKQQEHYEVMKRTLETLSVRYSSPTSDSLSQCLKKIRQKHVSLGILLEIKGYNFSLVVRPEAQVPDELKLAKDDISELSRAAKAIVSVSTKLQEMISSLLKDKDGLARLVENADSRHQEQKRLQDNLRENLKEAQRAKELSSGYRKVAGNLLNEAAGLSRFPSSD